MNQQVVKICILGGGFGGLYTALRLTQLPWENSHKPEITLIDKSDRFLFSPLLYELMTGEMQTWEIAPLSRKSSLTLGFALSRLASLEWILRQRK